MKRSGVPEECLKTTLKKEVEEVKTTDHHDKTPSQQPSVTIPHDETPSHPSSTCTTDPAPSSTSHPSITSNPHIETSIPHPSSTTDFVPSPASPLLNDTILRACRGEAVDHVPVWMMRQAGRYLPEFKEVRKEYDFFTLCQTPKLAAELTMQPLRRYPLLDAVIIFSDILVIPQAMGFKVEMKSELGPVFESPLNDPNIVDQIKRPDMPSSLSYVYDAIRETIKLLEGRVPLIGFSGAPWTLLSYMVEGKTSKTWSNAKRFLYNHASQSHKLLSVLADLITDHLCFQIEAGASLVQVFDSWSGILSPSQYSEFCQPYLDSIARRVRCSHPGVPLILFAKGAHYLDLSSTKEYDVVGLDWTMDPKACREKFPGKVLQGNLDPCALYASPSGIRAMTKEMIESFGTRNYIANLGHGLYPDLDPDHVAVFVDEVNRFSKDFILRQQHDQKNQ